MAQDKSKRPHKNRKAYLKDIRPNLSGEYVYVGAHYRYAGKDLSYGKAIAGIAVPALLSLAAFVAAGFVNAGGMSNTFYVLIPYMAEAIAVFTLLWAVCKLLMNGQRVRDYIFDASFNKLPVRALLSSVFAAVGMVSIIVFVAINGPDGSMGELVLLFAAKILAIVAPLVLRKLVKLVKWEKEA